MRELLQIHTPWRAKWYPRAVLFGLAIAFVVALLSGSGPTTISGRLGGDYPQFYGIGRLIAEGDWSQLYSREHQREFQKGTLLTDAGLIPYYYPPHFAFVFVPLAQLPFRLSYAVYVLVLTAALAGTCILISRIYPKQFGSPILLFTVALTANPLMRAVMGGQNTTLTILLIVLCWFSALRNRQYLSGVFLGLLFFKPQFALPLTLLFLVSNRWRVGATAALTGVALIALGTMLVGPSWFGAWHEAVSAEFHWAMTGNVAFVISWMGLAHAIVGQVSPVALAIGLALSTITAAALAWVWFSYGRTAADLNVQIGLAAAFVIVVAPQTLFYDGGIAMIALVVMFARAPRPAAWLVGVVWLTSYLQFFSPHVGISLTFIPLFLIQISAVILLWPYGERRLGFAPQIGSGMRWLRSFTR